MPPTLSIIIVTYNPGNLIFDCLHSLTDSGELSTEIIVVDNASADDTPERVRREFPQVRMVVNQDNKGFAAANNQGLALARGRYLLLLNPDVVIHSGALAAMVDFLENSRDVGIVGPRVFDGNGRVSLSAFRPFGVTILWQFLGLDRVFPYWVHGYYRQACERAWEPFDVGWVQGSCLMLRRGLWQQIGGLDESLFLFSEEPDLCERARKAGWRICYLPAADVTHYESSTVSRYPVISVRHHHLSPLYYFRKRGNEGAVLVLKLGFTVELLTKTVIRLFQLLWHPSNDIKTRLRAYVSILGEAWRY